MDWKVCRGFVDVVVVDRTAQMNGAKRESEICAMWERDTEKEVMHFDDHFVWTTKTKERKGRVAECPWTWLAVHAFQCRSHTKLLRVTPPARGTCQSIIYIMLTGWQQYIIASLHHQLGRPCFPSKENHRPLRNDRRRSTLVVITTAQRGRPLLECPLPL